MIVKRLLQGDTAFLPRAPSNALRAALHVSGIDRIAPIQPARAEASASIGR